MPSRRAALLISLALVHGLAVARATAPAATSIEIGPGRSLQQRLVRATAPAATSVEIGPSGSLQHGLVRRGGLQQEEDSPGALADGDNSTVVGVPAAGEASSEARAVSAKPSEKEAPSTEASETGRPTFVVAPPARANILVVVPSKSGALVEDGRGATPPPLIVAPPAGENVVVIMPKGGGGGKNESLAQDAADAGFGGEVLAEGAAQPAYYALRDGKIEASASTPREKDAPVVVVPVPGKNVLVIMPGNPGSGEGAGGGATLADGAAAAAPTNPPVVVAAPHGENLVVVIPEANAKP